MKMIGNRSVTSDVICGRSLLRERQFGPLEGPYEYVKADVVIDGVKFKKVGLRKKGLLGSQSATRPSFKIKLDYKDKKQSIDGYSLLTLNNNRQDPVRFEPIHGLPVLS